MDTIGRHSGIETAAETAMEGPAFAGFFQSERTRLVRALAVTLGDADRAAEAVDEAMARAWDRWERVRTLDAPAGWVYRVAMNHGRSLWRRRRREVPRRTSRVADERDLVTDPSPLDDDLQQAVLELPSAQRAVVVLRLLVDLDTAATAEALDIAEGTVRSRLSRAVAKLRSTLEVSP